MPLRVRKQPRETSQSLTYRFSQKIRKSGILFEARKKRFKKRKKSRQLIKRSALRREPPILTITFLILIPFDF